MLLRRSLVPFTDKTAFFSDWVNIGVRLKSLVSIPHKCLRKSPRHVEIPFWVLGMLGHAYHGLSLGTCVGFGALACSMNLSLVQGNGIVLDSLLKFPESGK